MLVDRDSADVERRSDAGDDESLPVVSGSSTARRQPGVVHAAGVDVGFDVSRVRSIVFDRSIGDGDVDGDVDGVVEEVVDVEADDLGSCRADIVSVDVASLVVPSSTDAVERRMGASGESTVGEDWFVVTPAGNMVQAGPEGDEVDRRVRSVDELDDGDATEGDDVERTDDLSTRDVEVDADDDRVDDESTRPGAVVDDVDANDRDDDRFVDRFVADGDDDDDERRAGGPSRSDDLPGGNGKGRARGGRGVAGRTAG